MTTKNLPTREKSLASNGMRLLGKIFYGVFIAALASVALLLLATLLPITGALEIKIVKSGSMAPAINTGSLVLVVPAGEVVVGDIITFGRDTAREIPTTHRVVGVSQEGGRTLYQTKGDANEEQDPSPVPAADVLGKVWLTVPYAGYVLDFARQPMGFGLLIGVPAAMIVLDEAFNIFLEVKKMRARRKLGAVAREMPVPQKPQTSRHYTPPQPRVRIPTI